MRKLISITALVMLSLVIAAEATAQVRGRGRLQGIVTDEATGKPIQGATVTLSPSSEKTQPILAKTDAKGRWSALGLTAGKWNIDIAANGFETGRGSAAVSEMQMVPMIRTQLAPAARQEEPAAAAVNTPLIPQEAVDAINEGQELLKTKVGVTADEAKGDAKRAVANFEKALPLVPVDNPETQQIRQQLMQVMAQAYYRAADLPKAISMLEQLNVVDPWTTPDPGLTQRNVLLVNLYLEHGDLEKGKALLERLPASAVTDPTVYTNIGVLFLNKNNPADALTYFTKAVDLDPKRADSYYYRGLSQIQLKKYKEARADFAQVIALGPNTPEAKDAKEYLASLR